ncbi:MAG: IS21-like element helper ATPase IstB [Ferrimicrobium sp.]
MTNQITEALSRLRLEGMLDALEHQQRSSEFLTLSFDERLGHLLQTEIDYRDERRMIRLLKTAKLRSDASIEDLDFRVSRGLDRSQILSLGSAGWVRNHEAVTVLGATGVGKTYVACALAHAAIRQGYSALYLRYPRMLEELIIARGDGRLARLMTAWSKIDVVILDDFLIRPIAPDAASDTLEMIEDRQGVRSTILTSQLPIANWHEAIGDPTLADAILDRITQNLHRIELHGESLRRSQRAVKEDRSSAGSKE